MKVMEFRDVPLTALNKQKIIINKAKWIFYYPVFVTSFFLKKVSNSDVLWNFVFPSIYDQDFHSPVGGAHTYGKLDFGCQLYNEKLKRKL